MGAVRESRHTKIKNSSPNGLFEISTFSPIAALLENRANKMLRRANFRLLNKLKNWTKSTVPVRLCSAKPVASTDYTHFGYETVKTQDKTEKGRQNCVMFINKFIMKRSRSPQSIRGCSSKVRSHERCHVTGHSPRLEGYFCRETLPNTRNGEV